MFSVNLTFDKTLMMQLNLNSFALSSTLVHTQLTVTVHCNVSAKVFKLSFEYLHIYSPKSGDFCRKK